MVHRRSRPAVTVLEDYFADQRGEHERSSRQQLEDPARLLMDRQASYR
ncbi:MAG: hypothetical protein U5N10_07805 [Gemmobacter sp.]|nr:hypothetical protein [Gemmobacter sp.]